MHCAVWIGWCGAVFFAMLVAVGGPVFVQSFVTADGHASCVAVRVTVPGTMLMAMHSVVLVAVFAFVLVAVFASVIVTHFSRPRVLKLIPLQYT